MILTCITARLPSGKATSIEWPVIDNLLHVFNCVFTWKTGFMPDSRPKLSGNPLPLFFPLSFSPPLPLPHFSTRRGQGNNLFNVEGD